MFSGSRSRSHIAHVEDAEEDSGSSVNGIEGTRKYAMSEAPKPNSGKSRSDRRPVNLRSSSASVSFDEPGPSSDRRGKPPSTRTSERKQGDMELRAQDRERRRRERQMKDDEEEDRRAASAAQAKTAASAKAKDQDARPLRKQRPSSLKLSATLPEIQQQSYKRGHVDSPANYGIQQPAMTVSHPQAQTRPASYYAGQFVRPTPLNRAWYPPLTSTNYAMEAIPPSITWQDGLSRPPYPTSTNYAMEAIPPQITWQDWEAAHGGLSRPSPVGPPTGYLDRAGVDANPHSHLRHRFETRPSSAMGFHRPGPPPPPSLDHYDQQEHIDEPPVTSRPTRRPSRSRRADDDRKKMPPPEHIPIRPQSALPPSTPYRPPPSSHHPSRQSQSRPPPAHRRSVGFVDEAGFDDDDLPSEDGLFHDISPNASSDPRHAVARRPRRASVAHDSHGSDLMPAPSRGKRPSTYGSALPSGGVSHDDKYAQALYYQDAFASASSQMPLTAEMLRKAGNRAAVASSRSTRSSGSRDDSENKRSNATGLTRTSINSDDFTIKVSGGARVRVPGAEIECDDGGEITFSTRPSGSRSVSDKASLAYPRLEDSRSRLEHRALPYRARAPSQSDSQSRGYAPSHAGYDFPGYF
ncbi:hypothetical protein NOR_06914 [Metarhizium rileyi]|uniref:Uncharacterized protein n=1 Tax=Metarhizium rileyi (strain RCEF 4871) TaxID=1649241 RepID=A0A166ZEI2_METRR|nr:hypothetical protein NOR_06914 [Metarhizium rileyi RCEF 4871]